MFPLCIYLFLVDNIIFGGTEIGNVTNEMTFIELTNFNFLPLVDDGFVGVEVYEIMNGFIIQGNGEYDMR